MSRPTFAYLPSSHLDLFWLGNYKTCLERGAEILRQYVERCLAAPDETFLVDTVVFAEYFLERCPELRAAFLDLVREGRLEIGAAYIDRWETLIPGESLIRNVQLGQRWHREVLGITNPTITHPDLPSMTPQIAQLYTQAGLRYYVTSRKVFPHGQVWRYQSPDGSHLLVLNYPRHYVFALMDENDDPEAARRAWVRPLEVAATLQGFPLGTVLVSGSSGDLADREDFVERYGRNLEEYVALFREKYPQFDFTYSTAARVLAPYEGYADLPCLQGEIPSVWGVAADEEVTFFQRDREIERRLLTAETLAAVMDHLGLTWRPADADQWQGTFYEGAFFARKDPIPPGKELDELWRMHVFTQDHNGGGQEGALSTFQKRVIQQRCLAYTQAIVDHALAALGHNLAVDAENLIVFNSQGQDWSGVLPVHLDSEQWQGNVQFVDAAGALLPAQVQQGDDGQRVLYLALKGVPAVGYAGFPLRRGSASDTVLETVLETEPETVPTAAVQVAQDDRTLRLANAHFALEIDRSTGNLVRLADRTRGQEWGGAQVGALYAVQETGNDVTLRVADAPPVRQVAAGVEVTAVGPLFTTVRIRKQLLKCEVVQTLTVWNHEPRLDLETRIYWWGAQRQQVRLVLPSLGDCSAISYGAPFYGVGWTEIAAGTSPRNSDEIAPADQLNYREVQGWLHLAGEHGGLTIITTHPAFHCADGELSAVLLRTAPSCGDPRLFWENAGEQVFRFTLRPAARDWRSARVQEQAACDLRPPVARLVRGGGGSLPPSQGFLQLQGASAALSSLYVDGATGATLLRLWETAGAAHEVTLAGALAQGQAQIVNLLGEEVDAPLSGQAGSWQFSLPAWGIRTVRISP